MPGAGQDAGLASLDVQFGGMDLQFGAGKEIFRLSLPLLTLHLQDQVEVRRQSQGWTSTLPQVSPDL